ncbi:MULTISPECIES: hypothetical protein [unclassified Micromonospora]|uniref:hypothetical protein n=1 Tax=unclassified Micromonospora TaxID=2617518 RepID=UPI001B37237B|nr:MULTISPECIES: hypothetical protein [unclassified Micromonospora]MBQ1044415.1 hypothetical protein [Micromonospora sp. C72]MBQ1056920.1 hypothetical protein [Micromonospora sp. C32]
MTRPVGLVQQQGLLMAQQKLTAQAAKTAGEAVTTVPAPTAFLRDPAQLVDHSGIALESAYLQNLYQAARRDSPRLTTGEFLAGGAADSLFHGIVDSLLGPAAATMLRTTDPDLYRRALVQAFHDFRFSPTPYDGGIAYSRYRYQVGHHVALPEELNVLPMNTPTGPDLHYPPYGPLVTARGHRTVGMVMASRAWGRDIPLDARGVTLFRALGLKSRDVLHAWDYDPDLLLSEPQIAHMISTGAAPVYQFRIVRGTPSARTAAQARWELAARLEDDALLEADDAELQQLWSHYGSDTARKTGDPTNLRTRYARDPYYRMSRDELFEMALRLPSGWNVAVRSYEWEHGLPQRFTKRMVGWARELRRYLDEGVWTSRLSMLTGAAEPANLQLLSPWAHARVDLHAGRMFDGVTRVDRYGNRAVPTLAEVAAYDDAARAADFPMPGGGTLRPFPLTDTPRADEPIVAFDQHTLAELVSALHEDEWQKALKTAAGQNTHVRADWNQLVDRLNTHLAAYGMPAALHLPKI